MRNPRDTDAIGEDGNPLLAENAALRAELDALRARIEGLERLADSDTLTPLLNRRAFVREVERVAAHVTRHGTSAAVMFVDLDKLKAINDAHGHQAGDAALIHVARILQRELRATDMVARIGGDEFGLLLDRLDQKAGEAKAEALIAALDEDRLELGGVPIAIRVSVGLTMIRPDEPVSAILARADARMYAARAAQRSAR